MCSFRDPAGLLVFFHTSCSGLHFVFASSVGTGVVCHVTDVRDVHDVMNFVAEEFESTTNHVGEQERAEVSDVGKVIDRRAAAVHSHAVRFDRLKCFGSVGERVVELDFHRSISGKSMRLAVCVAQGRFRARG